MQWSRAVRAAGHSTSTSMDAWRGASLKGAGSRKRRFASALIVLAGIVPLLFSACGLPGGSTSTSLAQDQTFTYPYTNQAQISEVVLDPAAITYAADSTFTSMLYSGLVTYSPDLQVVPDAATWDIDSTGKVYTFHLRPNLHFSDGTPLTASDFAYSINRALDPHFCDKVDVKAYPAETGLCPPQGYILGYLGHIVGAVAYNSGTGPSIIGTGNNPATGVNVLDPQTLQIRLDSPIGYFLEALTYPFSYPVEQKFVDRYPGGIWVQHLDEGGTNGPFKVAEYDGNPGTNKPQQIILEPNPYWEQAWGKNLTLKKVIRPLYASNTDEYNAYRAGNYDYTDVPVQSYFTARGQSDFNEVPALSETYFGLNFDQPPFNNQQVRQAFSLALNKQLLVDRVENGGAIPTNHIVPKGMPGYNPGLLTPGSDQSLTGNQTEAVKRLQAAQGTCNAIDPQTGQPPAECPFISGKTLQPIKIYVNSQNTTRVAIADFAAQQWGTILKLNVQVVPTDPSVLVGNIGRPGNPYQMWIIGWLADYPDPQDWLSLQFTSNPASTATFPNKPVTGNNTMDINDPNLDKLLKEADVEKDPAKRIQLYNQAEQLVVQDVPWIPYEQGKLIWRMRPWVRGFGLNSLGLMVDVEWPNVYIASH